MAAPFLANKPLSPDLYSLHSTSDGSRRQDAYQPSKHEADTENAIFALERDIKADTAARLRKDVADNNSNRGDVNWLGSSYSGQDIRVVAHLYESASRISEAREDRLIDEQDFNNALFTGASALTQPGILERIAVTTSTVDERKRALEEASGLSSGFGTSDNNIPEQRALAALRRQVFANTNLSTFIGIANAIRSLEKIKESAKRTVDGIAKELENSTQVQREAKNTVTLGSLQTLSVQTHREKFGVRALGHSYTKGYTRGPRTIAGSMLFVLFDEHPLLKLILAMGKQGTPWTDPEFATLIPDQIPPIDLTIVFANEYGSLSELRIYGVEFINDGQTFSVDDLMTEVVMNFVARDVDIMTKAGNIRLSRLQRGSFSDSVDAASIRVFNDARYLEYLKRLKVRRSQRNR